MPFNATARHAAAPLHLRDDHITAFAEIAFSAAGIRLDSGKRDFLQMRLNRRMGTCGIGDYGQYITLLKDSREERQNFVEALTVHTTHFFREDHQYNWLKTEGLPDLIKSQTRVTFWSAACSSGQEGWSTLMTAEEVRRQVGSVFNYNLIGTDVSTAIVAQAAQAVYSTEEVETVPSGLRSRYFLRSRKRDGRYRIAPELRSCAEWRQGNLVTGEGLAGINAHVAFLRNVLIYFSRDTQATVIDRVVRGIRPGGYLLTGHSETGFSHPNLTPIHRSIFQKGTAS